MRILLNYTAQKVYKKDYLILCEKLIQLNAQTVGLFELPNLCVIIHLLILGEDRRFYQHIGFDIIGICRAVIQIVVHGKLEGASTIEQQLVRVLIGDFRRSIKRKIKEIVLATVVNSYIKKKNVPVSYLYVAHYGTNIDGIRSIMNRFELNITDYIKLELAAEIVARIKYPEPREFNEKQAIKIENRKLYLMNLYKRKYYYAK